jgi:molecular chaperone DnaJ
MVWIRMDKPKDYYQLLGVPRNATLAAIRRAYRRLSRADPSRAGDDFAELQAAWETLSDAERRRRYDDQLGGSERPTEAIEWSYSRRPAVFDLRRPVMPMILSAEIVLRPEEAAAGTVVSLDLPITTTCESCSGTGGPLFDCDSCGGEGHSLRRMPIPVHVPPGLREGSVFQVRTDQPAVPTVLLTVHLRRV